MNGTDHRPRKVLIVDDEENIRELLAYVVGDEGLETVQAEDGSRALQLFRHGGAALVLLDLHMPGMGGMEILREIRAFDTATPIIVLTGDASIESAVVAIKDGASDYLTKPFQREHLLRKLRQALAGGQRSRIGRLSAHGDQESLVDRMGPSGQVRQLIADTERVAPTDFTVIISGETGSGKELVARAIHRYSHRAGAPFVAVDCGAIQPTLVESELFGHEKGAFTGAERMRAGKFEDAVGGTLFLDEVQNLPLAVQTRFLRTLQERQICHVGGSRSLDIDLRVIAASNLDLAGLVETGKFRQDLYHRLNEFGIHIPPLRERREDILYLAKRFIDQTCAELRKPVQALTPAATECLLHNPWPGNVRELRNTIRRAVLMADRVIDSGHLSMGSGLVPTVPALAETVSMKNVSGSLKERVREQVMQVEREILLRMLRQTGGNKAKAARLLEIDYKTICTKARQYGIPIQRNGDE